MRSIVNKIGPELFKDFDKFRLIKAKSDYNTPGRNSRTPKSTNYSKTDVEISYLDELEITRAFSCLAELENI